MRQQDEYGNLSAAAFTLRLDKGEDYLSNAWLEYFHASCRSVEIQGVLAALRAKRNVGSNAKIAVMNIGDVLRSCADAGALVEVKPTGEVDDPSHTGIYGYVHFNADIAAVLARDVNHQIYPTV